MDALLQSKCRVCLSTRPSQLHSLDDKNNRKIFEECTFLTTHPRDSLPQALCAECYKNCQLAYKFRSQAIDSDGELRKVASRKRPAPVNPLDDDDLDSDEAVKKALLDWAEDSDDEDGPAGEENPPPDTNQSKMVSISIEELRKINDYFDRIYKEVTALRTLNQEYKKRLAKELREVKNEIQGDGPTTTTTTREEGERKSVSVVLTFPMTKRTVARLEAAFEKGDEDVTHAFRATLTDLKEKRRFEDLFSDEALVEYNWTGRGKKSIQDSEVFRAIRYIWFDDQKESMKVIFNHTMRTISTKLQKRKRRTMEKMMENATSQGENSGEEDEEASDDE